MPELAETVEEGSISFDPIRLVSEATAQLKSFETHIKVSNVVWQSFGAEFTQSAIGYSRVFANLEMKLLAELLTANANLSDGEPLFNASNTSSSAFDVGALDAALGWLTDGGLTVSGLLLASGKEASARTVLNDAAMTIPVVACNSLPAGSIANNFSERAAHCAGKAG